MRRHAHVTMILASSSTSRKQQLEKLLIPFQCLSPNIDETPQSGESARDLAIRLSKEKTMRVAEKTPSPPAHFIISGDQSVECAGNIYGKPLNRQTAKKQLQRFSGKPLIFHTAMTTLYTPTQQQQTRYVPVHVTLRTLSASMITYYLDKDQPFYCAGSLQFESLGIALIQSIQCSDPTAITGLPMIHLIDLLEQHGLSVL